MKCLEKGLPIVFFDRVTPEIETHKVVVDNYKGTYDAIQHLIDMGYRKISHMASSARLSITKERLEGYKAALVDNNLPVNESLIKYCNHGGMVHNEMENAVKDMMQLKNRPR